MNCCAQCFFMFKCYQMKSFFKIPTLSLFLSFFVLQAVTPVLGQDNAAALIQKVKGKLDKVKDYQAKGILITDVSFIKIPPSEVEVFFKSPDQFKIKKKDGISLLPKGGVNINLSSLLAGDDFTAVLAGKSTLNGQSVTIVKMLPLSEKSDVILSTLYIDEKNLVVKKAVTTTRDNGTYEMELSYGKYLGWGLPDKVVFSFSTKDYKLPKGVTMEYETGQPKVKPDPNKEQKGRVEIQYKSYSVNKGIPDAVFK